jgi:hypothetical protein
VAFISGLSSPQVDSCHLREMPLTFLVDRKGRIAISHARVVDPLVTPADPREIETALSKIEVHGGRNE